MENQEIDEEFIASDEDIETNDNEEGEGGDNKPNKNQSNFKQLYKKTKELEKALSDKDNMLATLQEELEEWKRLNPEISDDFKGKKDLSSMEERIFGIKNPDAEPYLKEIRQAMKEFNVGLDKAWKLVKVDLPEESKSKKDFDIGKQSIGKKDLSKVTPEEALELPKDKQREWRKIHGYG